MRGRTDCVRMGVDEMRRVSELRMTPDVRARISKADISGKI